MRVNRATFFDFAPEEFTKLRASLNIRVPEYVDSFKDHEKGDVLLKEHGSTGKSGSMFYFTNNKKYIIKSVADHEMDTILSCVHELCTHTMNNPETLIHYYGAHAIELDNWMGERQLMYFVVMKNLLDTSFLPREVYPSVECYDTWDLKGALFLRSHVKKELIPLKHADKSIDLEDAEEEMFGEKGESGAPLDNDWLDLHRRVHAPQENKRRMAAQLKKDC